MLYHFIPLNNWQNGARLRKSLLTGMTVAQGPSASEEDLPHRTYLLSRQRCTQKLFLF